jgi:uracil-DNA glycosylase family 4
VIDCPATHRNSTITICGESPGEDECWRKEGFVGKAGDVLSKICQVGGLDFKAVNLTNVAKHRPPVNDFGFFYNDKQRKKPSSELTAWYESLKHELLSNKPNVIVACGNEALVALTGLREITKRQGSVYESTLIPGLKVIALQHPSLILHNKDWQEIYISGRIVRDIVIPESKSPVLNTYPWEEIHGPTIKQIADVFREAADKSWRWVIDIETRGGGIACVGIGFARNGHEKGGELCTVVPIETTVGPYYSLEDEFSFWVLLQKLSDHNPCLILQNSPYDLYWLMDYGFIPSQVMMDTMTAHHRMYPELPKKLELLNYFYATGIPYYKDEGKTWGKRDPDEKTWSYCAKDLVCELRVSFKEMDELIRTNQRDLYQGEEMQLLPIALEMQGHGFPVDNEALAWTRGLVLREWKKIHEELTHLAGWDVNIGSPKQVPQLLYKQYEFPYLYNRRNADEDTLNILKTWLLGQKPKKHTVRCKWGEKKCQHRTSEQLRDMAFVLTCVMKERKLLKAESSYLRDSLYTEV